MVISGSRLEEETVDCEGASEQSGHKVKVTSTRTLSGSMYILPLFSLFPFPLSFPYQSTTNWYSVRIIHFPAYSRLLLQSEPRTGTGTGDATGTGTGAPTRASIASSLPRPEPCDCTSQQATLFFIIIITQRTYRVLRMTQPNKLQHLYFRSGAITCFPANSTPQCSEYGQFCYALQSHTCERSTP